MKAVNYRPEILTTYIGSVSDVLEEFSELYLICVVLCTLVKKDPKYFLNLNSVLADPYFRPRIGD